VLRAPNALPLRGGSPAVLGPRTCSRAVVERVGAAARDVGGLAAARNGGALGARDAAELEPFKLQVEGAAAGALAQLEALS
jgi:hypothetical protein